MKDMCKSTFSYCDLDVHIEKNCPNAKCRWCVNMIPRNKLIQHETEQCELRPLPCPNVSRGCEERHLLGQVEVDAHMHKCAYVTVECNIAGCRYDTYTRRDKARHDAHCPATEIPCSIYQCGARFQRSYKEQHNRDSALRHVALLLTVTQLKEDMITNILEQNMSARREIVRLRSAYRHLEEERNDLIAHLDSSSSSSSSSSSDSSF